MADAEKYGKRVKVKLSLYKDIELNIRTNQIDIVRNGDVLIEGLRYPDIINLSTELLNAAKAIR